MTRAPVVQPIVRWTALGAAVIATWLPIAWLQSVAVPDIPNALSRAEFVSAPGSEIPGDGAPWRAVTLPDDWRSRRPGTTEGWYRFRIPIGDMPRELARAAVYLPVVFMNAAVYCDGELIGVGGRFDPVARNANAPLLFSFPADLLHSSDGVLHVRVKADLVDNGFLPAIAIGPFAELSTVHGRAEFVRITLVWILMVIRLVVAAFTAAIWTLRRTERFYGWFALSAVAWVGAELGLVIEEPPVSTVAWYWLMNVAIGWWGIFAVRLVLSFVGASRPRAEMNLMIFGVVGSAALGVLAVSGSRFFLPLGVNLWLTLAFLASCYLFRGVVPLLRSYPDESEFNVVFVVASSVLGCVLFDLAMQLGLRPRGGITAPAYSSLVAILGMGWVLVRRFVGALRESQSLVTHLDERVRDEHAALDRSYEQIAALDRARALSEERERILFDVQDGLGSQLVSTLALVEGHDADPRDLGESVRAALDDLRLVIDSLDPIEGEILPALGTLRARMQPWFDAAGITVRWQAGDVPPIADFGPHKLLVLLRIVHDLFASALRVPGASQLTVRTRIDDDAKGSSSVLLEIELATENFDASQFITSVTGIDIEQLTRRAYDIGASLEAGPVSGQGASIRIEIPISPFEAR